jgi:hypothetical protein
MPPVADPTELTPEEIKAKANQKIRAIREEAKDAACDEAFSKVMTVTNGTAAAMAVSAPLGAMAGPLGIIAWFAGAAGIAVTGLLYAKREADAIYDDDPDAIDRWLSDEDYKTLKARTEKVRALAKEAMKVLEDGGNPAWDKTERDAIAATVRETLEAAPVPAATPIAPVEISIEDGWQPADLPSPMVEYLSKQIHILISATTGSGKTHLLRALCSHLANRGDHLVIADPKGSRWGELTPARKRMKTGVDYLTLIQDLHKELESRTDRLDRGESVGPHLWAIFDEWTLLKGKCGMLDTDARKAIELRLLDLIAAGRELNLHLIMVNQSHLLGDLSISRGSNTFSSGLRDNLCTLGLGCKITQDSEGNPMQGNSKSIDSMLADPVLLRDGADRTAAAEFHAALRRQPAVNRTFCLYASQLFIGQVPDLSIPPVVKLATFPDSSTDHGTIASDGQTPARFTAPEGLNP